ncbi:DCC1-like thiol-disulfide oxidoreductase family protein [Halomarina oriensis]|uniref:DUF393 domain-containing protein n=1 Tax=Halomarina oriensis TaxID=671145 RepID=A0A6B0GFS0_9EURY|nr:DCC1-like thiol-disulfide oxidoreductase family protein [Halomarina oriensis]MWG33672.1 DUF393 domain-containing protein [Halomarina oriensis]
MRFGVVNYFGSAERETPLNLALARVLVAAVVVWRVVWIDWFEVTEAPYVLFEEYRFFLPPDPLVLVAEQWLLVAALLAVAVGYRLRLSTFLAAVLLGHQTAVLFLFKTHGPVTVLFFFVYMLLFMGLYHDPDALTVDGFRHAATDSIDTVVDRLKSPLDRGYSVDALTMPLLAIGVVYFGSGVDKLLQSGLAWAAPSNLSRIILFRTVHYDLPITLGVRLLDYPLLIAAMSAATLAAEVGLLVLVLTRRSITLPVVLLLGMKLGTLVTVNIIFVDAFFVFGAFLAWDRLHERLASDRSVDVVFDDRCHFCARSLLPFKVLDVNDTVTFYSQSDVPERYRGREDVDFGAAMYAFVESEAAASDSEATASDSEATASNATPYAGYAAFRELVRQFGLFRPVVWLMDRHPVEWVGVRVYEYVAANRSRHFTCSVEPG